MKVLAIDPGYDRIGIAILEKDASAKEVIWFSECFTTDKKLPFSERLGVIGERVEGIIASFKPESCALEYVFMSNNQKTAMRVAEIRGMLLYIAWKSKLAVQEFTPNEIKVAVTGYGKSNKSDILKMLPRLIDLENDKKYLDDELDAIAVGITFFAQHRYYKKS